MKNEDFPLAVKLTMASDKGSGNVIITNRASSTAGMLPKLVDGTDLSSPLPSNIIFAVGQPGCKSGDFLAALEGTLSVSSDRTPAFNAQKFVTGDIPGVDSYSSFHFTLDP